MKTYVGLILVILVGVSGAYYFFTKKKEAKIQTAIACTQAEQKLAESLPPMQAALEKRREFIEKRLVIPGFDKSKILPLLKQQAPLEMDTQEEAAKFDVLQSKISSTLALEIDRYLKTANEKQKAAFSKNLSAMEALDREADTQRMNYTKNALNAEKLRNEVSAQDSTKAKAPLFFFDAEKKVLSH